MTIFYLMPFLDVLLHQLQVQLFRRSFSEGLLRTIDSLNHISIQSTRYKIEREYKHQLEIPRRSLYQKMLFRQWSNLETHFRLSIRKVTVHLENTRLTMFVITEKINCLLNSLMNTILNGIPYCNIVCNKLDKSLFYWPEFKPRNLPESPSHVFSTFSPLRHIWVIGLYIRYMLWQTSWFSIDRSAFLSIEDSWSSWWSDWVLPHPITLLVDFNPHLYPTQATLYMMPITIKMILSISGWFQPVSCAYIIDIRTSWLWSR